MERYDCSCRGREDGRDERSCRTGAAVYESGAAERLPECNCVGVPAGPATPFVAALLTGRYIKTRL